MAPATDERLDAGMAPDDSSPDVAFNKRLGLVRNRAVSTIGGWGARYIRYSDTSFGLLLLFGRDSIALEVFPTWATNQYSLSVGLTLRLLDNVFAHDASRRFYYRRGGR